jgi:protein-disulfide isomerase
MDLMEKNIMKINRILYVAFIIGIFLLSTPSNAKQTEFTPQQITQIQQTVHDYLINNPEILIDVSNALQQKQLVTAIKRTETAIPKYFTEIFKSDNRPVVGNPKGKVTLVEFFDYQCPHCEVMVPIISNLINTNPDLKVVFIEWPIFGDDSQYAAKAAIASIEQNRYYPFHIAMLKKEYPLNKEDVLALAKSVGINIKRLQQDMQNKAIDDQLKANSKLAQNINIIPPLGTPVFIIGTPETRKFRLIVGQTDQKTLQKAINEIKMGHT